MGDVKKISGDIYCNSCMEEKLALASFNNPNELIIQRSEILIVCRQKKSWQHSR